MLYNSKNEKEWNKMNQEEKYREDLEYQVFSLNKIAEKLEEFHKSSLKMVFDICRKEENCLIEEFDGGGVNYPSVLAVDISSQSHELLVFQMEVKDKISSLQQKLEIYDNKIKFGKILVVCEEHQKEVTWIDDSNYYCDICGDE